MKTIFEGKVGGGKISNNNDVDGCTASRDVWTASRDVWTASRDGWMASRDGWMAPRERLVFSCALSTLKSWERTNWKTTALSLLWGSGTR